MTHCRTVYIVCCKACPNTRAADLALHQACPCLLVPSLPPPLPRTHTRVHPNTHTHFVGAWGGTTFRSTVTCSAGTPRPALTRYHPLGQPLAVTHPFTCPDPPSVPCLSLPVVCVGPVHQDELSEHRDLQMAYDKQCQDLYRLRMQLQEVRSQGNDAESFAAQTNRQHKQVRQAGGVQGVAACNHVCGQVPPRLHACVLVYVCEHKHSTSPHSVFCKC